MRTAWLFLSLIPASLTLTAACGDDSGGTAPGVDAFVPDTDGGAPVPTLERLFATEPMEGCTYASPVRATSMGEEVLVAVDQRGTILGVDPETGDEIFTFTIEPRDDGTFLNLLSTPALIEDGTKMVLAWQEVMETRRLRHDALVFDLETRAVDPDYERLELGASVPTYDGSDTVTYEPRYQLQRSDLLVMPTDDTERGLLYISMGNGPSVQPYHGWVFEIDLDAWQAGTDADAIINTLLTTQELDCGAPGSRTASVCGGGVWTPAGIQPQPTADGSYEFLVATGNGRLDFDVGGYAYSVMRVGRGLGFDRACDETLCAPFDDIDPARDCLESCENLFVPRLEPGDDPLVTADDRCTTDTTFMECYFALDADLGSSAPAVAQIPDGPRVVIQPGKDGALYLFDYEHMGTMYQRMQAVELCGTADDECRAFWLGHFVTHPAITEVDGDPVAIVASLMGDETHAAGIMAIRLFMDAGEPRMEKLWQVPDPDSEQAKQFFRHHPGRPLVVDVGGEPWVFVVETRRGNGIDPPGMLWGVRVRDGVPAIQQPVTGAGQRFAIPLLDGDRLYVSTCDAGARTEGRLEAFRIVTE